MTERILSCVGGCGRSLVFSDRRGQITLEVRCEECYLRKHGEPSEGFVGFVNGWIQTCVRENA